MLQPHSDHRGIKIVSKATGTLSGVKRKAPNEGHRTLGLFLARDGSSNEHNKVITEKAVLYAEAIAQTNLWRGESGMAYNSFYMESLSYGTPATSLSYKEYDLWQNQRILIV
jgi:hypothetical protein